MIPIPQIVYLLCALTSVACAVLLFRSYGRNPTGLLLWSGFCFVLLAISNILLFVDLVIVPQVDLSVYRSVLTASGLLMLVYGLISKPS
jgi:uncharacterized membrane protein